MKKYNQRSCSGGKEEDYADEIEEYMSRIQKPQKMQLAPQVHKETIQEVREFVDKAEPTFIRLYKFEESVTIFEKVREKLLKWALF